MDKGYEAFCLSSRYFYDSPSLARDDDVDYAIADLPIPDGWERDDLEDWLVHTPVDARFPLQGWKLHVSASLTDAEKILQIVWDYCIPRDIAFKFVRSAQLLLMANGKYAHRGSSGKFVTIYPADETQLEAITAELGADLAGLEGPYILSDVRWQEGPLYVRYGAFAERYCLSESGELTPAIEDPSGELVPDRRGTTFAPPPWATIPAFLEPAVAARRSTAVGELPYRIDKPLHFSNGGGVYAATDERTGEPVVLKEARPHAGLAIDGSDAVERLENERDILRRLGDLDVVPGVRDYFVLGGHHFLVLDFVDGVPLGGTLTDWYPLALLGEEAQFDEYTAWALDLMTRLSDAVACVHARGIVIGDLHPNNVLVTPGNDVVLIDLEIASAVDAGLRSPLGDPGFAAPDDRVGFAIDEYALASIQLSMFMPLTELIGLDESKAAQFAAEIKRSFPVPDTYVDSAVRVITTREPAGALPPAGTAIPARFGADDDSWPPLRAAMVRAILASATPERDDRLFPGDIAQFESGGLNLAYGAAGVLHALHATGAERRPDHEAWLVSRALAPQPGTRFGFYDGLHGIAYALERLGRRDDALDVLGICISELAGTWPDLAPDLFGGLAGIGLNLAHFARTTADRTLWIAAAEVAEVLADGLGEEGDVALLSGGREPYAGLMRGSSGPALFFLRMHEHFGDPQLLDLAATALRQDLRRCVLRSDGSLEVNEGARTMPYLMDGSIGIAMVLDEYLAVRADTQFAEASAAIRVAAQSPFYVEPGLFSGRAGMIAYLAGESAGVRRDDPMAREHIARLAWHAVGFEGGLAFPGDQLLRLSMDLATGTAGVLLAVGAALHGDPVALPFLGSEPPDRKQPNARG